MLDTYVADTIINETFTLLTRKRTMSLSEPRVAIAGNTSFPGECDRCSCDVRIGDALCNDCSRSVPMFEQATSFKTVLDMLIQAEEDAVWNR